MVSGRGGGVAMGRSLTLPVGRVGDVVAVDDVAYHDESHPPTAHTQTNDARCLSRQVRVLSLEDRELRLLHLLHPSLHAHIT